MNKPRMKKSVWIPAVFALYSAVVYAIFIPRSSASVTDICLTVGVNVLILLLLWFLYRRKEKMAERRRTDMEESERKED